MDSLLWIFCENPNRNFGFSQKITTSKRGIRYLMVQDDKLIISIKTLFALLKEKWLKENLLLE